MGLAQLPQDFLTTGQPISSITLHVEHEDILGFPLLGRSAAKLATPQYSISISPSGRHIFCSQPSGKFGLYQLSGNGAQDVSLQAVFGETSVAAHSLGATGASVASPSFLP